MFLRTKSSFSMTMTTPEPYSYDGDLTRDPRYNPWLVCQYNSYDEGDATFRGNSTEFLTRKPICVRPLGNFIEITVNNLGDVGSDLVFLDYRLIYCADPTHRPEEGFSRSHFTEIDSPPFDTMLSATAVSARSPVIFRIPFIPPVGIRIANVYLRAKARYLFGENRTTAEEWNPIAEPSVIEAHFAP